MLITLIVSMSTLQLCLTCVWLLQKRLFLILVSAPPVDIFQVGRNILSQSDREVFFGTIFGLNVGDQGTVILPILCAKPDQPITMLFVIYEGGEQEVINERFANAILNNHSRNFWDEIKRIRSSSKGCSSSVDGVTHGRWKCLKVGGSSKEWPGPWRARRARAYNGGQSVQ